MRISVRLFAVARQTAGRDSVEIELPDGATVGQLRLGLARQVPALATLVEHAMFALDAEYADDAAVINPDGEVACIPPVSGG
jgi:molybdopterin converting factor subunit 1